MGVPTPSGGTLYSAPVPVAATTVLRAGAFRPGEAPLRIATHGGRIAYIAQPGGDRPVLFRAVKVTEGEAVFENPEHDFPQRLEYRREDAHLTMTISGIEQGQRRTSSWSLVRASPHGASPAS